MQVRSLRAVVVGVALAWMGCAGSPAPQETLQTPGALLFNGYTKPEIKCYECHNGNAQGRGIKGPNLVKKLKKINDEEYFKALHKGPLLMPSYTKTLTEDEMKAILEWLRSL
jgi:mono/diheme cytochrome c family protein